MRHSGLRNGSVAGRQAREMPAARSPERISRSGQQILKADTNSYNFPRGRFGNIRNLDTLAALHRHDGDVNTQPASPGGRKSHNWAVLLNISTTITLTLFGKDTNSATLCLSYLIGPTYKIFGRGDIATTITLIVFGKHTNSATLSD